LCSFPAQVANQRETLQSPYPWLRRLLQCVFIFLYTNERVKLLAYSRHSRRGASSPAHVVIVALRSRLLIGNSLNWGSPRAILRRLGRIVRCRTITWLLVVTWFAFGEVLWFGTEASMGCGSRKHLSSGHFHGPNADGYWETIRT